MKRGPKITLLSLFAGGLIAAFVLVLVTQLSQPLFSPPNKPREWARQVYEETFLGHLRPGGIPTISTTAPVVIEVSREAGKVKVETEGPESEPIRTLYEIFEAETSGQILLPTGNRLRLDAVGIVMPEDIVGEGDPEGSMSDISWLDPENLEPLPEEKTRDWESRRWVSGETPKLFIRISNEGDEAIRWLGVEAFDDRTLVQAQSGSTYYTHEKDGQFGMDLDIWHQTPLRIAVIFSFGKPEVQDLELKPDAEVRFGDDALVRVIEVAPTSFGSTGSRFVSEGSTVKHTFSFSYSKRLRPGRGVVFHVWPAHNEKLIDFALEEAESPGKKRYLNAWGSDGITDAEFPEEAELVSVQVRRIPRLGRAVFLLPKIPRLPKTDNLFETPIARVELSYRSHMVDLVRKGAAVQWNAGGTRSVSDAQFPMTLENTTPAEVLRLNEELAGRPLFFDRKKLEVSGTRSGLLIDLKEWWRRNKPGWMP